MMGPPISTSQTVYFYVSHLFRPYLKTRFHFCLIEFTIILNIMEIFSDFYQTFFD